MNELKSNSQPIDALVLWEKLVDLEDGSLLPDECEEVMNLLEESKAARRLYAEFFLHSEGLAAEARFLDEQGRLPVLFDAARSSRLFFRSFLVAAAVLVIGAIVASLVMLKKPEPVLLSAASTADARWTVDGLVQNPNADGVTVGEGATVQVTSGTLKLLLESGASMVLQGPARVSFPQLGKPVLDYGWLWLDSGESDESFEVRTPELIVRDIGTRFGVRVTGQGPAEVHLIEGKIEVLERATGKEITVFEPKQQGLLVQVLGEPMTIPLARDPFPDLAKLLADKANYATTIRSQSPTGYWRIEGRDSDRLINEISGGVTGGRHHGTQVVGNELTKAAGFEGFDDGNLSVVLLGEPHGSGISLGMTPVHEGVLFRDSFSGGVTGLHGRAPEQTMEGVKWVSSPAFRSDGEIGRGPGSATLAFEPRDGCLYTLDASFAGIRGDDDHWLAFGFANGQSSEVGIFNRFVSGSPEGRLWMLARGDQSTSPNMTHTRGTGDGVEWGGPLVDARGGGFDLRIVLDTTSGSGMWTASWYAKRTSDTDYICVRADSPLVSEMIGSVGLAASGGNATGIIKSFSLQAERMPNEKAGHQLAEGRAHMARREGAVSFWVRRAEAGGRREVLWSAGDDPRDGSMQARLEADGRVTFFMENGRYDVLLTSQRSLADGRWHHVAMSWSSSSVDIYLDGQRVARDNEGRSMQQGILTELRFGYGPNGTENAPLKGSLDEIAVWDRPLEAAEVLHQFQSAKGK